MTRLSGTSGNDVYGGAVGIFDEAVVASRDSNVTFSWDQVTRRWVVNSPQGSDALDSIERVELSNGLFSLRVGGETRVNSTVINNQSDPSVSVLASGTYVVSFTSDGADGDAGGVFFQLFTSEGELIGTEIRANTTTASSQTQSQITALANGSFVLTWQSYDPVQANWNIYSQMFDSTGSQIGGETLVNTFVGDQQIEPEIASLSGGGYVIIWKSLAQDGSVYGVFGQRFDANGSSIGAEFQVNANGLGNQDQMEVAGLSNGGFVVVWRGDDQDGAGTGNQSSDIYLQRYDAAGNRVGAETVVNPPAGNQTDPEVVAFGGGYLVGWRNSSSPDPVSLRVFDNNGTQVAAFDGLPSIFLHSVAALADGRFAAVYQTGSQLNLQLFDADLQMVGGPQIVNFTPATIVGNAEISSLADGGLLVTWTASFNPNGGDSSGSGVFSQRFDSSGTPVLLQIAGDYRPNQITFTDSEPVELVGGAGDDILTSGTGSDILNGGGGADVMSGGFGNDTYIADSLDTIQEDINGGSDTVVVTADYVLTSRNVENIRLVGNVAADLTGNELDNVIYGNSRDNTLNGSRGRDTMYGGGGNDTYIIDQLNEAVVEFADEGTDEVISSVTYVLGNHLENLRLLGSSDIAGSGNALDNTIVGNSGSNALTGNGGDDILIGGLGDDTYTVDLGDIITEEGNGGNDTVRSNGDWELGDNIENLVLLDGGAFSGVGNDLNNTLTGNLQSNILDGGRGGDAMYGGGGADVYIIDDIADIALDINSSGVDEVRTSVSYTLLENSFIENLTLTGVENLDGTGNSLNNVLRGNFGNNVLFGAAGLDELYGGAGNDVLQGANDGDRLIGGIGNDIYRVFGSGDTIIELSEGGIDTVRAEVSDFFQLGRNLENLVLIGGDIDGYGNELDNRIEGTAGDNVIDGGAGVDFMAGGDGNDSYFVDSSNDVVDEAGRTGRDQVFSSTNYILGNGVESLTLLGSNELSGGGNALNNRIVGNIAGNSITGNLGRDVLFGGAGDDFLNGNRGNDLLFGGLGNDRLYGGEGSDIASYEGANGRILIDLRISGTQDTLSAGHDTLSLVENVYGSSRFGDTLIGNSANNELRGLGGDDSLSGGGGNDRLLGGTGDDIIFSDVGNDFMDGGIGIDTLDFSNSSADITIDLSITTVQNSGVGFDRIINFENVRGSTSGNDKLAGDYLDNEIYGLGGNDLLIGGSGDDLLNGGGGSDTADYSGSYGSVDASLSDGIAYSDGFGGRDILVGIENLIGSEFDDTLEGNSADNRITGGLGRDLMSGAGGNDVFIFNALEDTGISSADRDVIEDFSTGDLIDLSSIDANLDAIGNQAFNQIINGNQAFTQAGQLRLSNGVLYGNTDGDADPEFAISLFGVASLQMADFIL